MPTLAKKPTAPTKVVNAKPVKKKTPVLERSTSRPSARPRKALDSTHLKFATRLKSLREGKGWRQVDAAAMIGIGRVYLANMETGIQSPTLAMLKVLSLGFRISLSELVDGL